MSMKQVFTNVEQQTDANYASFTFKQCSYGSTLWYRY